MYGLLGALGSRPLCLSGLRGRVPMPPPTPVPPAPSSSPDREVPLPLPLLLLPLLGPWLWPVVLLEEGREGGGPRAEVLTVGALVPLLLLLVLAA